MKTYGEWRYSSTILHLDIRWRWMITFMFRPIYPREIAYRYPCDRRLDWSQSRSVRCGEGTRRSGKIWSPSFDTRRTTQKTTPPTILRCRGNVFTELIPSNDKGIHRPTDTRFQQFFYYCVYSLPQESVYLVVAWRWKEGYYLPSRCVAAIGGIHIQTYRLAD
jgi:hypothetical protein